jgi:hypothetical protein
MSRFGWPKRLALFGCLADGILEHFGRVLFLKFGQADLYLENVCLIYSLDRSESTSGSRYFTVGVRGEVNQIGQLELYALS